MNERFGLLLERMRIFKDEEKLSPDYIPSRLPHRNEEFKLLKKFFSGVVEGYSRVSTRVIVTGSVGTGKSALVKLFGANSVEDAKKSGISLNFIYVNCRISKNTLSILTRIIEQLRARLPTRGFSNEELFHKILSYLEARNLYAIIALDEVDTLISRQEDALYLFSRIGEERRVLPRISLILITRNPEIFDLLDESTRSSLLGNVIHLREYSSGQLYDILKFRAEEAFLPGVLMEESLRLIADLAGERGDARYALDILWRAGKYAEAEGSMKVTPEHVRKASTSVYPSIRREHLEYLDQHEQLILLALSRGLQEGQAYLTTSELNQYYRLICEEYSIQPKAYTRFWEHLQRLDDLGIIRINVRSEGMKGRRSYISIPGIPVSILQRELESILKREKKFR
ncbi:MAG: ORC1-type DNA replication protein [Nitrososphaeria archaeon]|nr:ORC1-type DNA replication protein [Aigarchaeota archaeon]MCX8187605.1 ORC1-type DNA replication protein [Nitrososphaeria archaeon]MDW8021024.1 ORC1-type DNA replication protein [Nitrososphaerota archaeon]